MKIDSPLFKNTKNTFKKIQLDNKKNKKEGKKEKVKSFIIFQDKKIE